MKVLTVRIPPVRLVTGGEAISYAAVLAWLAVMAMFIWEVVW